MEKQSDSLLISVVIPMHNAAIYLHRCLDSICNQTYNALEVILVDDGSIDNTKNICDDYLLKDERFVYVFSEGKGVSCARNIGIDRANAKYIVFIDADDWIDSNYIEILARGITSYNADIYMISYFEEFTNKSKKMGFFKEQRFEKRTGNEFDLISTCLINSPLGNASTVFAIGVPWAKIYKKAFLDRYSIRFVPGMKRMQDCVFNIYAFHYAERVVYEDKPLYHYRRGIDSVTHVHDPSFEKTSDFIIDEIRKFFYLVQYPEDWKKVFYAKVFMNYLECIRTQYISDKCDLNIKDKVSNMRRIAHRTPYDKISEYISVGDLVAFKKVAYVFYRNNMFFLLYLSLKIMRFVRRVMMYGR